MRSQRGARYPKVNDVRMAGDKYIFRSWFKEKIEVLIYLITHQIRLHVTIYIYIYIYICVCVCVCLYVLVFLFGFYGISTFVGYLMPNPFLYK